MQARSPLRLLLLSVWVLHAANAQTTSRGLLDNMVETLLGEMTSTVQGASDAMDDTLRKTSVLSEYFGAGMRRRDLTLPQIVSTVFSRHNGIGLAAGSDDADADADAVVVAAAVNENGDVSGYVQDEHVIVTTAGDVTVYGEEADGSSDGGSGVEKSDEDREDEKDEDEEEKLDMTTPMPWAREEGTETSGSDKSPKAAEAADQATLNEMADWGAFISSEIWESPRARSTEQGLETTGRIMNGVHLRDRIRSGAAISAKLFYDGERKLYCTGTLVHRDFVLTAAHCAVQRGDTVRIGGLRLHEGYATQVAEVMTHPRYNAGRLTHDVALVQLAAGPSDAQMRMHGLRVARLNRAPEFPGRGFVGVVSGHGSTRTDGRAASRTLRTTRQTATHLARCREKIRQGVVVVHESFLCADADAGRGGATACVGDSGAALWRVRREDEKGEAFFEVVATVSFGEVRDDAVCPRGWPSVFQRTSSNWRWAQGVLRQHA